MSRRSDVDGAAAPEAAESQPARAGLRGPTSRVGHLLRRAYQFALENSARAFDDLGITPRQAGALWEVHVHGPLSQRELGERIGMDAPNVHALVARLERKGLVAVAPDKRDPRRKRLTLTKAGQDIAIQTPGRAAHAEESTLLALPAKERATLIRLLERVVQDGGAQKDGGAQNADSAAV